jgi:hypothetical protein
MKKNQELKDQIISDVMEYFFVTRKTLNSDPCLYPSFVRRIAVFLIYTEAKYDHRSAADFFKRDHAFSVNSQKIIRKWLSNPNCLEAIKINQFFNYYGYQRETIKTKKVA